ncbi:MAG TPA: hypothetical protein VGH24_01010 [Solirubrobacteraceae bacterium]|jgi:hypothetical protein
MSTESEQRPESGGEGRQPTEEELRAAYEAQIKQVRVEHILLEHVVTVANLGLRRTGLAPGTEDERDPEQVRLAVDSIRALLPLLERSLPEQAAQIRDALSQLEFAFLKIGGAEPGPGESEPEPPKEPAPKQSAPTESAESEPPASEDPGPAQRSGRLWVPGQ